MSDQGQQAETISATAVLSLHDDLHARLMISLSDGTNTVTLSRAAWEYYFVEIQRLVYGGRVIENAINQALATIPNDMQGIDRQHGIAEMMRTIGSALLAKNDLDFIPDSEIDRSPITAQEMNVRQRTADLNRRLKRRQST